MTQSLSTLPSFKTLTPKSLQMLKK